MRISKEEIESVKREHNLREFLEFLATWSSWSDQDSWEFLVGPRQLLDIFDRCKKKWPQF
ncbi:MAG: hypothetical protein HY730_03665 [Candidatus Tectomicrobia bacterium]|uniref:Uncharacterized protein n=1 Tax=Tectimicrobiota bacterium TaxID=2528274 RepID=A0A933GKD9_UNCTE|nr:hypothetical protein [Candidatus Tectomicrobia bacterium]